MDKNKTSYYDLDRISIQKAIGEYTKEKKILDIGCGTGKLGEVLKKKWNASFVAGIELNIESSKIAEHRLDLVINGDIEKLNLNFDYEYFDLIICGDILEHLIDPWETLAKLKNYLKINGLFCISIPDPR